MPKPPDRLRVVKTLSPGQPGALRLGRKYGRDLVCVRYRMDDRGLRYTTVELVVDRVAVVKRPNRIVGVRVEMHESSVQSTVKAGGGKWDKRAQVWRMPYSVALALGLQNRVVENA